MTSIGMSKFARKLSLLASPKFDQVLRFSNADGGIWAGNLVSASQAQDQMEGGLFLNVVVGKRATVFQLLAGENQPLLIRRNA